MRIVIVAILLSAFSLPTAAQTKRNPFIDPPAKEAVKPGAPPVKKKNPFTDPDTKPEMAKRKSTEVEKPAVEIEESKGTVIVPMTRLPSGHFLVKVKLNGQGPYQLVFDTGAPLMLLNSKIAKAGGVTAN